MDTSTIVATFHMYIHALMAKVRLESEGIEVILENENTVLANPFYSYALGGVVIRVRAEDKEQAISVLGQIDHEQTEDISSFCPQCDSENLEGVERRIFGFKGHPTQRCKDCGYQWCPVRF